MATKEFRSVSCVRTIGVGQAVVWYEPTGWAVGVWNAAAHLGIWDCWPQMAGPDDDPHWLPPPTDPHPLLLAAARGQVDFGVLADALEDGTIPSVWRPLDRGEVGGEDPIHASVEEALATLRGIALEGDAPEVTLVTPGLERGEGNGPRLMPWQFEVASRLAKFYGHTWGACAILECPLEGVTTEDIDRWVRTHLTPPPEGWGTTGWGTTSPVLMESGDVFYLAADNRLAWRVKPSGKIVGNVRGPWPLGIVIRYAVETDGRVRVRQTGRVAHRHVSATVEFLRRAVVAVTGRDDRAVVEAAVLELREAAVPDDDLPDDVDYTL